MKLKPQVRTLEVRGSKIDVEKRTVEFPFSSEVPCERWWGNEVLSHDAGACDLSRFNDGANHLFNHDWDVPIGVIERAWIGPDKRGYVSVRFSKNAKADEVFKDIQDGVLRNVSVGYEVKELKLNKEVKDGPSEYIVTKWMPFETSTVTVPADTTVGVGRGSDLQEKEVPIIEPV